jgi:hypothetical protein
MPPEPTKHWRIHFITSWDDEPADAVIRVPDDSGGLVEATSEAEAREKFEADPRAKFYIEEASWWPVPEGMSYRDYNSEDTDA